MRSSGVVPPQMPCASPLRMAKSRHCCRTGQPAQICSAVRICLDAAGPVAMGKNRSGSAARHALAARHSVANSVMRRPHNGSAIRLTGGRPGLATAPLTCPGDRWDISLPRRVSAIPASGQLMSRKILWLGLVWAVDSGVAELAGPCRLGASASPRPGFPRPGRGVFLPVLSRGSGRKTQSDADHMRSCLDLLVRAHPLSSVIPYPRR